MRQSLQIQQRLTLQQKIEIRVYLFTLKLELVGRLRNEQYIPIAKCPECGKQLSPSEILNGFLNNPKDFTTGCPQCKYRFEPKIISFGTGFKIELPFYCDCQTLDQLSELNNLLPEEINRKHPAIYRSAIIHHGGLKQAFKKIDIEYPYETINGWEIVVMPFLGRMTDVSIAHAAGIKTNSVRKLRLKHNISAFSKIRCAEKEL